MSNKEMKQTIVILAAMEALVLIPLIIYAVFFK